MPRIHTIDPTSATGETAALFATARSMFGATPNFVTTAANAPAALDTLLGMFKGIANASLGAKFGEQVAIAVAQANGCAYCLSAHSALGGMLGLDAAALDGARRATAPDVKTTALLKLAVAIVDTRGDITDASLAQARAHGITDAEVIEVIAHVALNVFTNYLNNVSQTEVDFPQIAVEQAA